MSTLTDQLAKNFFEGMSPEEVMNWQRNQKISADGVVGAETLKAYNSYKKGVQSASGSQFNRNATMNDLNNKFKIGEGQAGYGDVASTGFSDFFGSVGGDALIGTGQALLSGVLGQPEQTQVIQQARHGQGDAIGTLSGLLSPISNVSATAPRRVGFRGGFV